MTEEVKEEAPKTVQEEVKDESKEDAPTTDDKKVEDVTNTETLPKEEEKAELAAEPSDLEKKIIRQVEYYFGDVNLPRDKFLQEKITEDEGWITVECLTTFKRLQQLSTDLAEIASALKKSKNGILQVNETDLKVRRSPDNPVPDRDDPMVRKAAKLKTLYIKGFPESYTLDDIQDLFTKLDVSSVFVKLKTDQERKFTGAIFVELTTQEQADKLLNNKDIKCGENTLTIMTRDDHWAQKDKEKKENEQQREHVDETPDKKFMKKPGCVFHFKGAGEGTSREDLKELFGEHAPIAWVDFNRGDTEGFIRFAEEGAAQKVIDAVKEANDGKILIKEVESTCRAIEGEEEENYWKMVEEDMKKQRERRGGGGRGGRGRGGRGGRRGGGRNDRNFKRKRPWEDNKKENTNAEHRNEHKRFDDESADTKKAKVEE